MKLITHNCAGLGVVFKTHQRLHTLKSGYEATSGIAPVCPKRFLLKDQVRKTNDNVV